MLGRGGFKPPWARCYIPNKERPITGFQNPGPTKPNQTNVVAIITRLSGYEAKLPISDRNGII